MKSNIFVAFQVCRYLLGFTKSISMLLQDSDMELCCAYELITNFQATFEDILNNSDNEFHNLYSKANSMAEKVGKAPLTKPRMVGRQILRNNVVSDTAEDYFETCSFFTFYR